MDESTSPQSRHGVRLIGDGAALVSLCVAVVLVTQLDGSAAREVGESGGPSSVLTPNRQAVAPTHPTSQQVAASDLPKQTDRTAANDLDQAGQQQQQIAKAQTIPTEPAESPEVPLDAPPAIPLEDTVVATEPAPATEARPLASTATPDEEAKSVAEAIIKSPALDKFSNPIGTTYGLADEGEFKGQRILVWTAESEIIREIVNPTNPLWVHLRKKGFDIRREEVTFQREWLDEADQLWLFSGQREVLNANDYDAIVRFVRCGGGLYLCGDNAPYVVESNAIGDRLYNTEFSGGYIGRRLIAVRGQGITWTDYARIQGAPALKAATPGAAARVEIIRRAGHYVDQHAILTGINFLFEGITVSHFQRTNRLKEVLMASNRQPLAGVSARKWERVVIDCGSTRYFSLGPKPPVKETAGTLRYAENIAAYLAGKDDKADDYREWAKRRPILREAVNAGSLGIRKMLASTDPVKLAIAFDFARLFPELIDDLIEYVRHVSPTVRQLARSSLRAHSMDVDYGPEPNADVAEVQLAYRKWRTWRARRQLLPQFAGLPLIKLRRFFNDPNSDKRWAATAAANQKGVYAPNEFIQLLKDSDPDIRAEAIDALRKLSKRRAGFGLTPTSTDVQIAQAIEQWTGWWNEKSAKPKLDLAKKVIESQPEVARQRLQSIVRQFPNTNSAKEAARLLATM